jgi:hypothetical protein
LIAILKDLMNILSVNLENYIIRESIVQLLFKMITILKSDVLPFIQQATVLILQKYSQEALFTVLKVNILLIHSLFFKS